MILLASKRINLNPSVCEEEKKEEGGGNVPGSAM
jgi:hypothetical protein